jgi:Spy/CpxP family protein refolding chaperone
VRPRRAALVLMPLAIALACADRQGEPRRASTPDAVAPAPRSPYAGWEGRPIKALAPEEVERLLAGEGMGYALAAELNRYPGPRHVLDLADSLELSAAQRDSVEAIRARMNDRAVVLGRALVAAEAALDSSFASGAIDRATLRVGTAEIAQLEGELRAAHLEAHLETRGVLADDQVARYDVLRGYAVGPGDTISPDRDSARGEHRHR